MNCQFCYTGRLGLMANLQAAQVGVVSRGDTMLLLFIEICRILHSTFHPKTLLKILRCGHHHHLPPPTTAAHPLRLVERMGGKTTSFSVVVNLFQHGFAFLLFCSVFFIVVRL